MIDINRYFTRIGYVGDSSVSFQTLRDIHVAHAFSIPFENLAIHEVSNNDDLLIKLDENSIEEKLVINQRGGYCFETSELLAMVLTQLGFDVQRLFGNVFPSSDKHKLLLVTIDDKKYIADVGFGGNGLIEPLPLIIDTPVKQFAENFMLTLDYPRSKEIQEYVLHVLVKDEWTPLYSFTLNPYLAVDYEALNYYASHVKTSIFVTNKICTLPTPNGRIVLNNDLLKIRYDDKKESINVAPNEYLSVLEKYFNIKLPSETVFK